jgi:hypothetical protein
MGAMPIETVPLEIAAPGCDGSFAATVKLCGLPQFPANPGPTAICTESSVGDDSTKLVLPEGIQVVLRAGAGDSVAVVMTVPTEAAQETDGAGGKNVIDVAGARAAGKSSAKKRAKNVFMVRIPGPPDIPTREVDLLCRPAESSDRSYCTPRLTGR